MKHLCRTLVILAALGISCTSCRQKTPGNTSEPGQSAFSGTVIETMNTAGYTYVHVKTETGTIWAAAPEFKTAVGESVTIPPGMPMKDYRSQTLDRTFDTVYFVSGITVDGREASAATVHGGENSPHSRNRPAAAPVDITGIEKPPGGKTIGELYAEKGALAGKKVTVRGKVVKYNRNIMGKNWVHLMDGTGKDGQNDLTVTTKSTAKVGDTLLVSGVLVKDRDFGFGYRYDLIIEDASVTVE